MGFHGIGDDDDEILGSVEEVFALELRGARCLSTGNLVVRVLISCSKGAVVAFMGIRKAYAKARLCQINGMLRSADLEHLGGDADGDFLGSVLSQRQAEGQRKALV